MARPIVLAITTNMLSAVGVGAQDERIDQFRYNNMVMASDAATAFIEALEAGDELTEHNFTAEQGVGEGRLFTRDPTRGSDRRSGIGEPFSKTRGWRQRDGVHRLS